MLTLLFFRARRRGERCDIPSMYFFRGMAFSKLHEWVAAVDDFDLNVGLTEQDPDAYTRRAVAWSALQNWDKAHEDLSTALELDASAVLYAMRGRLLCCMRRFDEAIMDYKRSLAMDRDYEVAKQGLAEATKEHDPLPLVSQHS